jgi:septum formation protein
MPDLLLGSASPRRAQLLSQLGVSFAQRPADIDESAREGEDPVVYVQRMAREKALALDEHAALLLTADTTVVLHGESLGKPVDRREARSMLERLSGTEHEVCTAVCLKAGDRLQELTVCTTVEFAALPARLIEAYLDTGEPWDKAGAYAIQGLAGSFVRRVNGSVSNVIGLPLLETRELLEAAGVATGLAPTAG